MVSDRAPGGPSARPLSAAVPDSAEGFRVSFWPVADHPLHWLFGSRVGRAQACAHPAASV